MAAKYTYNFSLDRGINVPSPLLLLLAVAAAAAAVLFTSSSVPGVDVTIFTHRRGVGHPVTWAKHMTVCTHSSCLSYLVSAESWL